MIVYIAWMMVSKRSEILLFGVYVVVIGAFLVTIAYNRR